MNNLLFPEFLSYIKENDTTVKKSLSFYREDFIDLCIFKIFAKSLVYLINEKRENKYLIGINSEERYEYFTKKYVLTGIILDEIRAKFPNINNSFHNYFNSLNKLGTQITSDYLNDHQNLINLGLADELDNIVNLQVVGDMHNAVAVVKVNLTSRSLYYKPHLDNYIVFNEILKLLNSKLPANLKQQQIKFSASSDHTWVEEVKRQPLMKENVHNYFSRMGGLIAIAYSLNMTDLHFENIVSYGDYPVILDMETICGTKLNNDEYLFTMAQKEVNNKIFDSVLNTGLLPMKGLGSIFGGDVSGMMGGEFTKSFNQIVDINKDTIHFEKKIERLTNKDHLPYYIKNNDEILIKNTQDYLTDIVYGFNSTYDHIRSLKNEIMTVVEKYDFLTCRVIFRQTIHYSLLLELLNSPIYQNKSENILSKLSYSAYSNGVLASEKHQLLDGNIPIFNQKFGSINIFDSVSTVQTTYLTPIEILKIKLSSLSSSDKQFQEKLICFSLQGNIELYLNPQFDLKSSTSKLEPDELITQSINNIKQKIINNSLVASDGTINWFNVSVGDYDELELEPMDDTIYKGMAGVKLPFLLLSKFNLNTSSDQKIISGINKSLDISNYTLNQESFYEGTFGSQLQTFKENPNKILQDPHQWDALLGASGTIIGIYQNFKITSDLKVVIEQYANYLVKSLKNNSINGYSWFDDEHQNLVNVSFAHGNSGCMTALLISYAFLGKAEYLDTFKKAWKSEQKFRRDCGWEDTRNDDRTSSANWCHGSTGVLISRLIWFKLNKKFKILNEQDVHQVYDEISHSVSDIIDRGLSIKNFSLCHGIMGNLIALNEYSLTFSNEEVQKLVQKTLLSVCSVGLKKDWLCGVNDLFYNNGLMTGLAGILYGIVKIYYDDNYDRHVLNLSFY
ncbi:type 2 lantibiotic biosynthesis protein LanM [Streptococcus gallolyticus]|uniref:Type 2 lantibiotic biosynthesis protein LanM n=1 Tax=Streptococcus gallolyticus TaxID=315405 RepID=A0A1H9SS29_9STRE|nr:type 2 lanthipeptide synthetase LanM family protein [Streptococcus gallolyticus]SEF22670.1 type 2 lantibiotic biosynthesis protein LanM [Streptococcus gallolyticus]SEM35340.1 type 2 lantibiotic biosynthesis protein LanM [Streptococcus gallolyticus]SER87810.1 type 2 lantibiotic biosynthesis protein LanM [Streptococcus gallolyticus]